LQERFLFVDDEEKVLDGIQRQLGDEYDIDIATSGPAGLKLVHENPTYACVVSDMRMPEMNGTQFLKQVREISPDTTRLLLTGYADLNSTIEAINCGNVFRFLTKPCTRQVLVDALDAGVHQYRLVRSEKELVEGTLRGSVKVLCDVLAMVNPTAFGRASQIRRLAVGVARCMEIEPAWEIDMAAMLSQIGCVTVPEHVLTAFFGGKGLTEKERNNFLQHPIIARRLLSEIPRMEGVARIVGYQRKHFDGSGVPQDKIAGKEIPIGSRILRVAADYDAEDAKFRDPITIIHQMREKPDVYDMDVVAALERVLHRTPDKKTHELTLDELRVGMTLAADVFSLENQMIVPRGNEITPSLLARLRMFDENSGIRQPILARDPATLAVASG
jgi:response regulator RpfG family c-di-GMP phosphodiesterase